MVNDPSVLFIALIDQLNERKDLNLLKIQNSETQDSLARIPLRDQIYEDDYNFTNYSTAELFMILLHL